MTTLYVSDLDGTLLNTQGVVSDNSSRILSRLTEEGALVTVATARTPATVEPLLSRVSTVLPAIVMTGAALWDRQSLSYIEPRFIPVEVCASILDTCLRHRVNPFVYTLGSGSFMTVYHNGPMQQCDRDFVAQRVNLPLKRFVLDASGVSDAPQQGTILFFAMGPVKSIFALADELRATVDCSVSSYIDIFGKDTGILEVFCTGVSKAEAVSRLACKAGADRVVVFGDNLNDLPMMKVADIAVAVGNALDPVKDAADVVIGGNDDDSVARFIDRDFHRGQ